MCKSVEGRADRETGASRDFSAVVADEIAGEQVVRASQIMDDVAAAEQLGFTAHTTLTDGLAMTHLRAYYTESPALPAGKSPAPEVGACRSG